MKAQVGAALVALAVLGVGVAGQGTNWVPVVKAAEKQVPRLEIQVNGDSGVCSGVVINAKTGVLVTCAHCVHATSADSLSVTVNGAHAEVMRANDLLDLALVRFEPDGEVEMPLAEDVPPAGSEIAVLGYSFGAEKLVAQFGRVAQPLNQETKLLWLNVDLIFGDSGGATIDSAGRLIGLNSQIYSQGPAHLAGAIPISTIRKFASAHIPQKAAKP